jgi:hypothetical protein
MIYENLFSSRCEAPKKVNRLSFPSLQSHNKSNAFFFLYRRTNMRWRQLPLSRQSAERFMKSAVSPIFYVNKYLFFPPACGRNVLTLKLLPKITRTAPAVTGLTGRLVYPCPTLLSCPDTAMVLRRPPHPSFRWSLKRGKQSRCLHPKRP